MKISNYVYQVLGRVLPQVFGVVSQFVFITDGGAGDFSRFWIVVISWTLLYSLIGGSVDTLFQKENDPKRFNSALLFKLVVAFLVSALVVLYSHYGGYEIIEVLYLTSALIMQAILSLCLVVFRIIDKDEYTVLPKLYQAVLLLVLTFTVEINGLVDYSRIYFWSWASAAGLVLVVVYSKVGDFKEKWLYFYLQRLPFKPLMSIGFSTLVFQFYFNIDFLILDMLEMDQASAKYRFNFMIVSSIIPLVSAFNVIFFSRLVDANEINDIDRLIKINSFILLFIFILFFFFLGVVYPIFALKLFSETLKNLDDGLYLYLVIGFFLNSMATMFSYLIIKHDKYSIYLIANIKILVISSVSSYLFISYFEEAGAYWNSIFINTAVLFVFYFTWKSILKKNLYSKPTTLPVIDGVVKSTRGD
jgi:O-antigen/teichoic acid export membrane protein